MIKRLIFKITTDSDDIIAAFAYYIAIGLISCIYLHSQSSFVFSCVFLITYSCLLHCKDAL